MTLAMPLMNSARFDDCIMQLKSNKLKKIMNNLIVHQETTL